LFSKLILKNQIVAPRKFSYADWFEERYLFYDSDEENETPICCRKEQ